MENKKTKYQIMMDSCPLLYKQRNFPEHKSCMSWGVSAGEGWFSPLNKLSQKLERLNESLEKYNITVQASQVKEKFGTLRFYYDILYVPTKIRGIFVCIFDKIYDLIDKYIKFDLTRVVDKEPCVTEEWCEITKDEFDSKKVLDYVSNTFGWKFKQEGGKYYRNSELHRCGKYHYEPKKHKFLYKIRTVLVKLSTYFKYYEPSDKQKMIYEALHSEVFDYVMNCEKECYDVCEECGCTIGTTYSKRHRTKGWIRYLCENCTKKNKITDYVIES